MPRDPAPELPTWSDYRFAVAPRVNGLSEPSPFEVSWWSELQDGAPRSSTDSRWDQQTRVMHAIECLARLAHKPELARDLVKACNLDFRWQARTATLQCDLDGRIVRAREAWDRLVAELHTRQIIPLTTTGTSMEFAIDIADDRADRSRALPELRAR